MDLAELEKHVIMMEDIQEIENLQMKYGYFFETQRGEDIVALFSEENTESVEITDHGLFKGIKGVRTMFLDWIGGRASATGKSGLALAGGMVSIFQLQGVVEVAPDGKTAKARWNCWDLEARPWNNLMRCYWLQGFYENEYIKENGKWYFKKLHWNDTFWTPYEDGWLKTPVIGQNGPSKEVPPDAPPANYHPYPSRFRLPYHYKHPITGK